jgi:hypothetical protein
MENKSIYQKLLKVQQEVAPIKKAEDNPFFKSKYFDINGLLAVLKPILNNHGLVLTQGIRAMEGRNILVTEIADVESKEEVESSVYLPEVSDPQKFGSAVTYYRRYALQSLFALEAQDDDGNSVSNVKDGSDMKNTSAERFSDKFNSQNFEQYNPKRKIKTDPTYEQL